MRQVLALLLLVVACGNQSGDTSTLPTTTTTVATTTTTVVTTTTEATTTTTPTADVEAFVDVYDDLGGIEVGEPCSAGSGDFYWVVPGTEVILEDANTDEVLAVVSIGSGIRRYEEVGGGVAPEDESLFWYCEFSGVLNNVPLDRDFYRMWVGGDQVIPDGVTIDGDEVRANRFVATSYFFTESESIRATYR